MCIVIFCFLGRGVESFEIDLVYLINPVFVHDLAKTKY